MKKQMNIFFFEALVIGSLGGYICSNLSGRGLLAGFVGFLISLFAMFVGMTLAFLQSKLKLKAELYKQEEEFQKMLQVIVTRERQSCGQVSVNMAKSMSDRIANKVVSKFVDGLSDRGKREAVLSSVDKIIEDEFQVMRGEVLKGGGDGEHTR